MLWVLLSQTAVAAEPNLIIGNEYYLLADDGFDHSKPVENYATWEKYNFNGLPLDDKNVWVQVAYQIDQTPPQPLGLLVSVLGSFDAYWDGEFIASNGKVGSDKTSEIPGKIDKIMMLPIHLTQAGTHTLSVRISTHHNPVTLDHSSFFSLVTDYEYLVQLPYKQASRPMVMSGALLLIAIYSLLVYFKALRQPSHLIFSGLCLSILALIFAESWRGLWPYSYDWQIPRLMIVLGLSFVISLLLCVFFAWFFVFKNRQRLQCIAFTLAMQAIVLVAVEGYDKRSLYLFLVGVTLSCGICLLALVQKQKNALLMLCGMVLFIAPIFINAYSYMDQYFFISFSALIGLMLYTLATTMRTKQNQLLQSQVNASRLELELVKRNLQPHFILNTLTAIEEWIEDSPKTAVKFIQALADEFRFMAHMSAQPIIQIKDEIDLCQSHLKVMSYRTNSQFKIDCQIERIESHVPPGVILTLLENALSHNLYQQSETVFSLSQKTEPARLTQTLIFTAPVTNKLTTKKLTSKNINLGIGSQYIEARLTESYADNWQMHSQLNEDNWQVTLTLPVHSHSSGSSKNPTDTKQ
jgi:hypothetical protein